MKKNYLLFILALVVFFPLKTNAFNPVRLIDPACFFACDNEEEVRVVNSYNTYNNDYDYYGNYYNYNQVARPPIHNTPVYNYDRPVYEPLGVSCYSSKTFANVGDTVVWSASSYGGNGNYYVSWKGTDGFSSTGQSASMRYNSSGSKTASVTVTSGNQTISRNCNSINVSDFNYNNYPQTPIYNYDGRRDDNRRNNQRSSESCVISRSNRDNGCYRRSR